jgi:hypothetical protein
VVVAFGTALLIARRRRVDVDVAIRAGVQVDWFVANLHFGYLDGDPLRVLGGLNFGSAAGGNNGHYNEHKLTPGTMEHDFTSWFLGFGAALLASGALWIYCVVQSFAW